MLVGVLPILLAFFTLFTSFSSGVPIEEDSLVVRGTPTFGSGVISNAERIARRLPLSKPKRLFDAARPRVALAPRASCMPVPGDYKIEVYYASDVQFTTVIGYVSGNGFDQGSLETNINVAPTFSSPCTFDVDNQVLSSDFKLNGASYPYYMVRSPTGGDLGNGAGASAFGFTPDQAGDAGAQTTAFRVDSGGEITVTYTNTDGTTGQPKIYNYQGTFFASRSATDLANAFGLGVTEEDEVVWVFAKQ